MVIINYHLVHTHNALSSGNNAWYEPDISQCAQSEQEATQGQRSGWALTTTDQAMVVYGVLDCTTILHSPTLSAITQQFLVEQPYFRFQIR